MGANKSNRVRVECFKPMETFEEKWFVEKEKPRYWWLRRDGDGGVNQISGGHPNTAGRSREQLS
jgi:hypothetical protein